MRIFEATHYADAIDFPIGSKWLQLEVINMWDFDSPTHAIKDGIRYTLRLKEMLPNRYHSCTIVEVTNSIKMELVNMGYELHKKHKL